jgi:hypothetical protein
VRTGALPAIKTWVAMFGLGSGTTSRAWLVSFGEASTA